jgi:hypothetical protein
VSPNDDKSETRPAYAPPRLMRLTVPDGASAGCYAPGSGDTLDCGPGNAAHWCTVTGSSATACDTTGSGV